MTDDIISSDRSMVSMNDVIGSGRRMVEASLVMGILSSMAVAIRIDTKSRTQAGFGKDDGCIWLALAVYWAYIGVLLWSVFDGGRGLDMPNFLSRNKDGVTIFLKSSIIGKCLFDTSLTAVKISILFFYHRIFSVNRIFMRLAIFLGIICLCWWIAVVLGVTLYCLPLESVWQPWTPGKCINFGLYFLGSSIIDLLVDVALLVLPCWMIQKLQLQRRVKWSLAGIFVLGSFVCITGIIRITFVYVPGNSHKTVNHAGRVVWSNIHLGTAIICACLPTYRPLLIQVGALWSLIRQRYFPRKCLKQSASSDSPFSGLEP